MAQPRRPLTSSASTITLRVLLTIIGILFAIATIGGALADTLSVTVPTSVQEGNTLNAAVTGPGTLTILIDNTPVASGTGTVAHALSTDSTSAGNRQYRFTTTDANTPNETRIVTIQDVPLTVIVTAPTTTEITDSTPTFSVTTNWPAELCYVVIDGTDTRTLNPTSTTSFASDLAIPDGVHTIQYKCKLNAELPSVTRTIHVDTTAPVVTASSPSGTQTGEYTTLRVTTDEIALCRYGQTDAPYQELSIAMGATYATTNQITLALTATGPQTHFIRCADVLGNVMAVSHIVSFVAQIAPAATIDVEEQEPLRAGSYKITLHTSTPLSTMPTLSYQFQSGASQQIGLTGSASSWEGYVLIPEGTPGDSLTFSYRGVGLDGGVGTQITDGALIHIDAVPPGPIDAIDVENSTNGITLLWTQHNPENGVEYKVYRADHEGVTENDEIARVSDTRYHDAASGSRYYWYRVIAIDKAGNYGPVSEEVYGSAIDPALANSPLDATTLARLDDALIAVDGMLATANATINELTSESNPAKNSIINDMQLIAHAQDTRTSLERVRTALAYARMSATSVQEADLVIGNAQKTIAEARSSLIRRVVPDQQVEARQVLDDHDVEANIAYALANAPDDTNRDALLAAALDARDHLTVTLSAASFSLWDWAGVEHKYTFVRKHIVLEQPLNDVTLVEIIPKSVASDVSALSFTKEPVILEQDPVVAYSFEVLQDEEITYVVNANVPLDEIKRTLSIPYPLPTAAPTGVTSSDELTGFAVLDLSSLPALDTLLLVIGTLVIVGLGAYYVSLGNERQPFKGLGGGTIVSQRLAPIVTQSRRPVTYAQVITRPAPRARTTTVPVEKHQRTVAEALAASEKAIDEREYAAALTAYREVISNASFKKNDVDDATRKKITRVYAKLMLHKQLDIASGAIEHKDLATSRSALAEVRKFASLAGEDSTTLINDAKSAYKRLMEQLNTLEINHAAKY